MTVGQNELVLNGQNGVSAIVVTDSKPAETPKEARQDRPSKAEETPAQMSAQPVNIQSQQNGYTPQRESWILRNPGVALSFAILLAGGLNWIGARYVDYLELPRRNKVDAAIRKIDRDVRTISTYQLESQRDTREFYKALAEKQGIEYNRSPELVEAEKAVRKLKNR